MLAQKVPLSLVDCLLLTYTSFTYHFQEIEIRNLKQKHATHDNDHRKLISDMDKRLVSAEQGLASAGERLAATEERLTATEERLATTQEELVNTKAALDEAQKNLAEAMKELNLDVSELEDVMTIAFSDVIDITNMDISVRPDLSLSSVFCLPYYHFHNRKVQF